MAGRLSYLSLLCVILVLYAKGTNGDFVKGFYSKTSQNTKNPFNMHSPSGAPSRRIASALSAFESNISKNSGHTTSRDFISVVASTPIRRPFQRRLSLTTAKDIEDEYEQILSLFDVNDTDHVVLSKDEDASFCKLVDADDEESFAGSYEPDVSAGVAIKESAEDFSEVSAESCREPVAPWDDDAKIAVKEDASSVASQGTNVTEAESCESDGESRARISILPSFEEQARMLRIRDRKPVVSVSPIKLKDRMRAFQQDMTLNAL